MSKKPSTTREAKPGELREIKITEILERISRRPESRIDFQRMYEKLSPNGQSYLKHLMISGPSSLLAAAKALKVTVKEIEIALDEVEAALTKMRG